VVAVMGLVSLFLSIPPQTMKTCLSREVVGEEGEREEEKKRDSEWHDKAGWVWC
jgi:hypothetical protein